MIKRNTNDHVRTIYHTIAKLYVPANRRKYTVNTKRKIVVSIDIPRFTNRHIMSFVISSQNRKKYTKVYDIVKCTIKMYNLPNLCVI